MTDREKAIVSAYTGVAMLVGDKMNIFYEYIAEICGRPIYTHELAHPLIQDEIKEKSKPDFIRLCQEEEVNNDKVLSRIEKCADRMDKAIYLLYGELGLFQKETEEKFKEYWTSKYDDKEVKK